MRKFLKMYPTPLPLLFLVSLTWLLLVGVTESYKDLSEEEINKINEVHLQDFRGLIRLYRGDSVSEFLQQAESCMKNGCDNCTVEPCNKFVIEEVETAYAIVKAFKTKLDSQYENIILMIMSATTICLSLYLWSVGHFSIRATWLYKLWQPDDDFEDPCLGIPMSLYTEMEFETYFSNDPRLEKIQKEEKEKLKNLKLQVDKSVQDFFNARPYLKELRNDPSVLEDIMAMKLKHDEKAEDESSSSEEEKPIGQIHKDELLEAEMAVHKFFEEHDEHDKDGMSIKHDENETLHLLASNSNDLLIRKAYITSIEKKHHMRNRGSITHPMASASFT